MRTKLIVGAALVILATAANAQYKPTGDDGITASPRLREKLNERAAYTRIAPSVAVGAVTSATPRMKVTASPRLGEQIAARNPVVTGMPSTGIASTGHQTTAADRITASPRLREQMTERSQKLVVAPVK